MITFDEKIPQSKVPEWDLLASFYGRDRVLMFDLETTGLTPRSSFIYIIGINLYQDGEWHILQLFNDDGRSEVDMIRRFMELLEGRTTLFHFNGDTFDIPFVRGRMEKIREGLGIDIPDRMSEVTSIDFLKQIRPFKYALGLPNVRQKTVEQYLGIRREDKYNGGQLIDVYLSYLSSGNRRNRDLVLLHNRDDMEGMFHLARMHALTELTSGEFTLKAPSMQQKGNCLYLDLPLSLQFKLPCHLITTGCGATLRGDDRQASLTLPVYNGDTICMITKDTVTGFFLPCFHYEGVTNYCLPGQRKASYIAANDALLGNPEHLHAYAACAVRTLMKQSGRNH